MTDVNSSAGRVLITLRQSAPDMFVSAGRGMATINFPTANMLASEARIQLTFRQASQLDVSAARVLVAGRGRIANPRVRAWTFSLDGHDFYVLRLGDRGTLVYDVYSEQWIEWADLGQPFWRANLGQNWIGGSKYGPDYGSDIVVGDDTWGVLYFLDPEQAFDQHPDYLNPTQEIYFDRIVMGQYPIKGREVMPCYVAFITSDMGQPAYTGAGVQLLISDDAGQSFDDMGLITVTAGEFTPELTWTSLGQIGAPGRLFKIVDDGAIARIDALEMNDPDDDG